MLRNVSRSVSSFYFRNKQHINVCYFKIQETLSRQTKHPFSNYYRPSSPGDVQLKGAITLFRFIYKAWNTGNKYTITKLWINSNFIMINIKIVIVVCVLVSLCASQEEQTGQTKVYLSLNFSIFSCLNICF